ncbi:DUF3164 family protein [Pedobacter sp. PAMC26386]|nr:DUF3164 family protein [Pedobacter sp. PAMC26386]
METATKTVNEMSAAELKALLAQKTAEENNDRIQQRKQYEALRDQTVINMVMGANRLREAIKAFKTDVWSDLETMYKLLQEHSSRHADGKGSFTLEESDGQMRVSYKRQDNTKFDERASQAERHILDFLTAQFGDSNPTSKLVRKLLERKKGQLEKDEVLKLISMKDDFENENWRKGIELLQESIVPGETKYYARFEIKAADGESWKPVVLDFAKL